MDIKDNIGKVFSNYSQKEIEAYTTILQLEKLYKGRTAKENSDMQKRIIKIIEEVLDDN